MPASVLIIKHVGQKKIRTNYLLALLLVVYAAFIDPIESKAPLIAVMIIII